jgi:hypothetical protein
MDTAQEDFQSLSITDRLQHKVKEDDYIALQMIEN